MKLSFSQRQGLEPKKQLQINGMDEDLRNSLWNVIHVIIKNLPLKHDERYLYEILWLKYFKEPLDEIQGLHNIQIIEKIKYYFFKAKWNKVYDFVEFLASVSLLRKLIITSTFAYIYSIILINYQIYFCLKKCIH